MTVGDAAQLIAPAITRGAWADLGAGSGTFTRALAQLLGAGAHVHAVDRDARAMRALGDARISTHVADFADAAEWGRLALGPLGGILLANALHFVPYTEQRAVLAHVAANAERIVVVEYEQRAANPYVPYPVDFDALGTLIPDGFSTLERAGTRRSRYGGAMYAAFSGRA